MNFEHRQSHQLSCPIINIHPIQYSILKIIAIIAAIAIALILTYNHHIRITIFLILIFIFFILYSKISNHPIIVMLFFTVLDEDNEDISQYAIYDLSYRQNEINSNSRNRKSNKRYIVNVHYQKQGRKFFYFKEELYKTENNRIGSITQRNILDQLDISNFQDFKNEGLSNQQRKISEKLFRNCSQYMKPNLYKFLIKRLFSQKELVVLQLFSLFASILVISSLTTLIILIFFYAATLSILFLDEKSKQQKYWQQFSQKISKERFKIIRSGVSLQLKIEQILVGDIIHIQRGSQREKIIIYFKSIMIGTQVYTNQDRHNRSFIRCRAGNKNIFDRGLETQRYLLYPNTFLYNNELEVNQYLLVLQSQSVGKFYSLWFKKDYYAEFMPEFQNNVKKILSLFVYVAIIFFFFVIFFVKKSTKWQLNEQNSIVLSIVITFLLLPSSIHLIFTFDSFIRRKKLQDDGKITVYTPNLSKAGFISNILIDIQQILQLQFQQIQYKNLIFDPSSRSFEPDTSTLENGRTYESLMAIIFYISMGYFDEINTNNTLLLQLYKIFENYFQYQDTLYDEKNIVHKSSRRFWRVIRRFQLNQFKIRSWLLQSDSEEKYIITECQLKKSNDDINQSNLNTAMNFRRFVGPEDLTRIQIYEQIAKELLEQGKTVKLLLFKNFKRQMRSQRQIELSHFQQDEIMSQNRQSFERNLQFAAFIVYDNALFTQNSQKLQYIRDLRYGKDKIFHFSLFSHLNKDYLMGFEHLIQYIPIYHSIKQQEKTSLIRRKATQKGSLIVGKNHEDIYSELISDVSFRINRTVINDQFQQDIPSDYYGHRIEDVIELLKNGSSSLRYRTEIARLSFILWLTIGIISIWLEFSSNNLRYSSVQIWMSLLLALFFILPAFVHSLFDKEQELKSYAISTEVISLSYCLQLFTTIIFCTIMIVITKQSDFCRAQSATLTSSHMLFLRHHSQNISENSSYECLSYPIFFVGAAILQSFMIFYGDQQCLLKQFQKWRFLVFFVWILGLFLSSSALKLFIFACVYTLSMILIKISIRVIKPSKDPKNQQNASN